MVCVPCFRDGRGVGVRGGGLAEGGRGGEEGKEEMKGRMVVVGRGGKGKG